MIEYLLSMNMYDKSLLVVSTIVNVIAAIYFMARYMKKRKKHNNELKRGDQ